MARDTTPVAFRLNGSNFSAARAKPADSSRLEIIAGCNPGPFGLKIKQLANRRLDLVVLDQSQSTELAGEMMPVKAR